MKLGVFLIFLFTILKFNSINAQGFRLAFGSCLHQEKELELLRSVVNHSPDAFVFIGDNVYVDSYDSMKINKAYQTLACNPNFQYLKQSTALYATWDDHDYGMDDAGKYYPTKEASKRSFISFFRPSNVAEILSHKGIYQSYIFKYHGKRIQLILLDTRTFRSSLKRVSAVEQRKDEYYPYTRLYKPVYSVDSSMLGEEQWDWLGSELKKRSAVTIIASSTQFATEYNGYETWANFPLEQERMLNLISTTKKEHVVFISGDVHYGELSKDCNSDYPLYDLTSSGISESWGFAAPNIHREEGPIMENNFGLIRIKPWKKELYFELFSAQGLRVQRLIPLKELEFK